MKKIITLLLAVIMLMAISIPTVFAEEKKMDEQVTYYNEALGKNITYVKRNGEWAAVINTQEDLNKYLEGTKRVIKQAMDVSFSKMEVSNNDNPIMAAAASTYSDDVLVRRVSGTYNFDCRCSYTVSNNKITYRKAYGELTGFVAGVRYEQDSSSTTIVNSGKSIKCYISGTITNYVLFQGRGVYTCHVTSGGTVEVL